RTLGRTRGTFGERTAALHRDLAYPNSEEARAAIMGDRERILRDAEKRAVALFAERPQAPVVARPYPRLREASAAASSGFPAPGRDGQNPERSLGTPLRAPPTAVPGATADSQYHPPHHALDARRDERHSPPTEGGRALPGVPPPLLLENDPPAQDPGAAHARQ